MFKKHSVQMKIVKDTPAPNTDPVGDYMAKLHSTEIAVDRTMKTTAKLAIGVMCAKAVLEIALHITETKIK